MKKISLHILILILLIGFFGRISHTFASQENPNEPCAYDDGANSPAVNAPCDSSIYHLLAPIDNGSGEGITDFDPGQKNPIGEYLNLMIKIFIGICAVLAVVMIVIAGMEYMTSELSETKGHAKNKIYNAIFGLLIALGAYTLLYTINPDILKTDLESLQAVSLEIDTNADIPQAYDPVTKKYSDGAVYGNKWDDSVARNAALPAHVSAKQPECTTVGQQGCTSIRGINTAQVQAIQTGCGCDLVITGGSESWLHGGKTGSTTHHTGSSTVDLRRSAELDAYLSGGKSLSSMHRYDSPVGSVLYEGNHWHIGR